MKSSLYKLFVTSISFFFICRLLRFVCYSRFFFVRYSRLVLVRYIRLRMSEELCSINLIDSSKLVSIRNDRGLISMSLQCQALGPWQSCVKQNNRRCCVDIFIIKFRIWYVDNFETKTRRVKLLCIITSNSFSMSKKQFECFQTLYRFNYEFHKFIIFKRVTETLKWFLQHSNFVVLRFSLNEAIFWIIVNSGCDKTVFAFFVIDELHIESSTSSFKQIVTCYFFFKNDNKTQTFAVFAFCNILHQLIFSDNRLITSIVKEYRAKKDKFFDDVNALWNIFINVVFFFICSRIVCVLNALNKCFIASKNQLIKKVVDAFNDLAKSTKTKSHAKLKLFIINWPLVSIEKIFTKISRIRLKTENKLKTIEKNIEKIIRVRIREIVDMKFFFAELQNKLKTHFTKNVDRTFL